MDSLYEGYSIQAQGLPGAGGPTGADAVAGRSGSMEPEDDDDKTGHLVQDEANQPNPENETVVSPGVVITKTDDVEE